MKLLLTSAGVQNPTIHQALLDLLGRPVEECTALCIPTASYGSSYGSPEGVWRFVAGRSEQPMTELGWKSVGVLELTALPSIGRDRWEPWVREADVLLANGGSGPFLAHWMRETGLADVLPSLEDTVYVGFSGGSMALTPRVGEEFLFPGETDDSGLGIVDFSIFPHVDHPMLDENTMAAAEKWAADLAAPAYAICDDTAIRVVDGEVDVVTEGHWRAFGPAVEGA